MEVTIRVLEDCQLINVDSLSRRGDLYTQSMDQATVYHMEVEVQHPQNNSRQSSFNCHF